MEALKLFASYPLSLAEPIIMVSIYSECLNGTDLEYLFDTIELLRG